MHTIVGPVICEPPDWFHDPFSRERERINRRIAEIEMLEGSLAAEKNRLRERLKSLPVNPPWAERPYWPVKPWMPTPFPSPRPYLPPRRPTLGDVLDRLKGGSPLARSPAHPTTVDDVIGRIGKNA